LFPLHKCLNRNLMVCFDLIYLRPQSLAFSHVLKVEMPTQKYDFFQICLPHISRSNSDINNNYLTFFYLISFPGTSFLWHSAFESWSDLEASMHRQRLGPLRRLAQVRPWSQEHASGTDCKLNVVWN
jgi:hypothetical protein